MKYLAIVSMFSISLMAASPEVVQYMNELSKTAKAENPTFSGFDAARGKEIFTSTHTGKQGKPMACTSCHTVNLASPGKNSLTGKVIDPLSPRANPQRLTSTKEVNKWLKRNFIDVYAREGTAQEKGDVLAYIMKN
jgi:mono/diheme cytochrome c family protein